MQAGPVDMREAYATFNMGAGSRSTSTRRTPTRACAWRARAGIDAWVGGDGAKAGHRKAVEIVPLGITFEADTLQVR